MALNQCGKCATPLDPTVGLRKKLTVCAAGLYGGVVRDSRDPSRKTVPGKGFNSIKLLFCALSRPYCVRRPLVAVLIVSRIPACV
jgi:hypothetical protein